MERTCIRKFVRFANLCWVCINFQIVAFVGMEKIAFSSGFYIN